ncbi:MAG: transketolase, partial [Candidatus Heimdallarchaeaceae archaeon]
MNKEISKLEQIAYDVRRDVISMMLEDGGHLGGSLSCVEVIVALYFRILRKSDKFILSKAHASATLYSVLSKKGIIDKKLLKTYGKKDSPLGVHAEKHLVPGVEFSCGSLGHGLSYAAGVALAYKIKNKKGKIFVLLGDGESQEGSVWEAALFAAQHKLSNLIAIIDYNKLQSMDHVDNVLSLEPLADKWRAFGWHVLEMDGHDFESILETFNNAMLEHGKPILIISHTIKGKGLPFLENDTLSHYR